MHGRRLLLALLTPVALLGTASFVLDVRGLSAPDPSHIGTAPRLSTRDVQPAVLTARPTDGAAKLVSDKARPQRLTGLTLVALLVIMAVYLQAQRRAGPEPGAAELVKAWTRIAPPRGPPLPLLSAS